MKVIGITGGTGAGKTTALDVLAGFGVKILDCDEIYHTLLENDAGMRAELAAEFGDVITGCAVDRKKLGAAVFGKPERLRRLNEITHKYVRREVNKRLKAEAAADDYAAAIDAIALIESGLSELCDVVVAVTAPEETRIRRIMAREGIDEAYARMRVRAQKNEAWFREHCDHVLENSGDMESFRKECTEYFSEILDN